MPNIPSFQNLAFILIEVESTSSPFATHHGMKSKHDSVMPTSPTAQDSEEHYLRRYFQKNFLPQKLHQWKEFDEVMLQGERG